MNNYSIKYHNKNGVRSENMRRIGRMRRKKQKKIIIVSTLSLLLILTVGYAAFSTTLSLKAKGNIQPRSNLYVSANGSDETGNGTKNKPYKTINKAYEVAEDTATINILTDLTINKEAYFNEKNITIQSAEGIDPVSLIRDSNYDGTLLSQYKGEVTIKNIVLDGNNIEANRPLLSIEYSKANLEYGTVFQNNIDNEDMGGGARFVNSDIVINGAKFLNNTTQHQPNGGGAAILSRFSNITIEDGEFTGNTSKYSAGGAIFFGDNGYKLTINGGIFKNNSAGNGGCITVASGEMVINGGEISNNKAQYYGGAIYIYSLNGDDNNGFTTLTINNGTITNNTAGSNGGGIYILKGHKYNYVGGVISNNTPNDVINLN